MCRNRAHVLDAGEQLQFLSLPAVHIDRLVAHLIADNPQKFPISPDHASELGRAHSLNALRYQQNPSARLCKMRGRSNSFH